MSSFEERKAVSDRKRAIEVKLSKDPELKCLPFVAIQAIGLVNDPKTTIREMGDLAETDAILTSKLLEAANNTATHEKFVVDDVHQAIHHLGFDKVKDIVFRVATEKLRENSVLKNLFKENLKVANLAKELCHELDNFKISDQAYVAGLLQGVGRLFLFENYPEQYMHMFNFKHEQLVDQEMITFGKTYPDISAALIRAWRLSLGSLKAVQNCYRTPASESTPAEIALFFAVDMANFEKQEGLSTGFMAKAEQNKDALARLQLNPAGLKKVFSQAYSNFNELVIKFQF